MWIFYLPFFVAKMIASIALWHFTCRCSTGPSGGSPRPTPCAAPCSDCRPPRAWGCRWRRRCNVRAQSARGGGMVGAFGVITLVSPKILSTGSYLYCVCMMLSPLAVSSMPATVRVGGRRRTCFPCRCPCACIWCARPCRSPPAPLSSLPCPAWPT